MCRSPPDACPTSLFAAAKEQLHLPVSAVYLSLLKGFHMTVLANTGLTKPSCQREVLSDA